MNTRERADRIQPGDRVIHAGEWRTVEEARMEHSVIARPRVRLMLHGIGLVVCTPGRRFTVQA